MRGLSRLEEGIDEWIFPDLFPDGTGGWPGGGTSFATYCRQRLLGRDPRFQQSPDYVFWLYETWLKREVSNRVTLFARPDERRRGNGAGDLRRKVFTVLGGVVGTAQYMFRRRSMAVRMLGQLGTPQWFLTLTSHELQPPLLLACVVGHLRGLEPDTDDTAMQDRWL